MHCTCLLLHVNRKFPQTLPLIYTNLEQRIRLEAVLIGSRRKEGIFKSDYLNAYPRLYGGHSRELQNACEA